MTTNLRLLLDECVTDPLAKMLEECSSALNIEYVRKIGMSSAPDKAIVEYAKTANRIVVTTETAMNHKTFRICIHPGIIVLGGKHRHETIQRDLFKKFLLSGHRGEANHAVTFLADNVARIKTSNDESVPDKVIAL